jgi:tRNA uracil 4-sulfurtransferase
MSSDSLFLVKYGEIALKKGNRASFVRLLKDSIRARLPGKGVSVTETWHRVYVRFRPEDREEIAGCLSRTFGLVSFCEAVRTAKAMEAIEEAARGLARKYLEAGMGVRFKVEPRRADKSFPLGSYQIACRLGDVLTLAFPELRVDVKTPEWTLMVEIREQAYLYGPEVKGPGGLPTRSSGRGVLLLSGGIDSPVAGYMMAKRGLCLDAVYYHSAPFTSDQAREKVVSLSRILSLHVPGIALHVVNFTPVLARIRERAHEEETTLLMRACMMRIASALAVRVGAGCLITGESLGQVASQTMESLQFTGSFTELPVFRPLVGMNKEEIIDQARRIGTFDTSNLPFADCCVLFSPVHPLIHPSLPKMKAAYEGLEIDELLKAALETREVLGP